VGVSGPSAARSWQWHVSPRELLGLAASDAAQISSIGTHHVDAPLARAAAYPGEEGNARIARQTRQDSMLRRSPSSGREPPLPFAFITSIDEPRPIRATKTILVPSDDHVGVSSDARRVRAQRSCPSPVL